MKVKYQIIQTLSIKAKDRTSEEECKYWTEQVKYSNHYLSRIRDKLASIKPDVIYKWSTGYSEPESWPQIFLYPAETVRITAKQIKIKVDRAQYTLPREGLYHRSGQFSYGKDLLSKIKQMETTMEHVVTNAEQKLQDATQMLANQGSTENSKGSWKTIEL